MPEQKTVEKARRAKREGKAATTQAGEFVRDEIRKIRRGEHGARSPAQAIAIGLSEARRAGAREIPGSFPGICLWDQSCGSTIDGGESNGS